MARQETRSYNDLIAFMRRTGQYPVKTVKTDVSPALRSEIDRYCAFALKVSSQ